MKKFLLFLLLLCSKHGFAQMLTGTYTQSLVDINTPSPDVGSLGKYGNIPVSLATGVPSISIPLYEIDIAGIKMPLSLSYHAGGIKVAETASSAGLGWSLSGIGMVSRSLVGRADEDPAYGLFNMPSPDSVAQLPGEFPVYLFNVQRGFADNEPDDFSYSTIDGSGRFCFRRDRSIIQIPFSNNKIEFKYDPFVGRIFQITDGRGMVYIYGLPVISSMSTTSTTTDFPGVWRLTKLVDANSTDTVYFSYESACNPTYQKNWNYSQFLGQKKECNENTTEGFSSEGQNSYQTATLTEVYPKQITWRGGKIVFTNTCDRTDVSGSAMRLREVNVYANQEGTFRLTNRVVLYHSYFNSDSIAYAYTNAPADQKRRLRLDSVGIMPVSGSLAPRVYRLTYDTTKMAPRESCAQDRWGFNNGVFSNYSLMPTQSVLWQSQYKDIGSANRQTDSTYMKACSIKSMQYPTGGKTVFDLAPHAFWVSEMQKEPHNISLSCMAGFRNADTAYFTVASNDINFKFRFDLPPLSSGLTYYPKAVIRDLTLGSDAYVAATPVNQTVGNYTMNNIDMQLIAGHSYSFIVSTFSPTSSVSAYASIDWTRNLGTAMVRKIGGGLRVKSISNYDEYGKLIDRKPYEYEGGTMLTDLFFQDMNVEQVIPRAAQGEPLTCVYQTQMYPPGFSLIFHANGVLPASQCNGSPLLYKKITEYQVDSADNPNGKTEYGYDIYEDQSAALQDMAVVGTLTWNKRGPVVRSYDFKNNFPAFVTTYKSTASGYQKVQSKRFAYQPRDTSERRIKITNRFLTVCCLANNMSDGYAQNDFNITQIDVPTGVSLKCRESDTTWDDWGNKQYTVTQYEYNDSANVNPTLIRMIGSEGDTVVQLAKYARDLSSAGNVYEKMKNRNMIGIPIQTVKTRNRQPLAQQSNNYTDFFGNGKLLVPLWIQAGTLNYPAEIKVRFVNYDIYGDLLQQRLDSGKNMAYIYGYDTAFIIATITNAAGNEVAYTSFEPDAIGYWSIPSATRDITQGITGKQSYSLSNGAVTRTIPTSKSFIVSYWSKGASATVNGSMATSSYNKNGWFYYEHKLNAGASSVSVSGSVTIDELRLYPTDAQMNTRTLDPLTGVTSECDVNNRIRYYEYDGFNALKLIRDEDRNVIKTNDYRIKL
jgi:hypothetical protein